MYKRILMAYNGTHEGRTALFACAEIAAFAKADTHLLAVASMPSSMFLTEGFLPEELIEEEKKRMQGVLDEGLSALKERGFSVNGHLAVGEPVEEICRLAVRGQVRSDRRRSPPEAVVRRALVARLGRRDAARLRTLQPPGRDRRLDRSTRPGDPARRVDDLAPRGALAFGDAPALVEGGRTLGYRALARAVDAAAARAATLGVRAGDRVLIVNENCAAALVLALAANRLDAWPVLVNARLSSREIDAIRDHCSPRRTFFTVEASPDAAAQGKRLGAAPLADAGRRRGGGRARSTRARRPSRYPAIPAVRGRDAHLHLRHDRRAEGRNALAREPACSPRVPARPCAGSAPATGSTRRCRSRTYSASPRWR